MPYLGNVPSSFNVGTNNIDNGAVTTEKIADGAVVNADVNASAAIAGTKISPDFGSQNLLTTGTATAASLIPTSSTVPTNGVYLPAANTVGISTNGSQRLNIDANGRLNVAANSQGIRFGTQANISAQEGAELILNNLGVQPIAFYTNNSERLRITSTGALNFVGAGTAGSTQAVSFNGSAPVNSLVIDSSGRLGIGTSSPVTDLQVNKSSDVSIALSNSSSVTSGNRANTSCFNSSNSTVGLIRFGAVTDNVGTEIQFHTRPAAGSLTQSMTLDSSGRLGIGITAPTFPLHILQSAGGSIVNFTNNVDADFQVNCTSGVTTAGPTSGQLALRSNSLERVRLDNSGRLLVGITNAATTDNNANSPRIQLEGTSGDFSRLLVRCNGDTTASNGPVIYLARSRGITANSKTAVTADDLLGTIIFEGTDGTHDRRAAAITAFCDGGVSTDDMPGRLVFATSPDGTSNPIERLRISQNGNVLFSNVTNSVKPAADNAVAMGASGGRWSEIWAANGTIQTSDERAKAEITDATLGADFIKALRPVSYKWVEGGQRHTGEYDEDGNFVYESVPGNRRHWGFIAQEVKEATDAAGVDFGGWVLTDKDDPDSQQALRYDQFIAPLTKALQEALAEIDVLKAKVAALEST